MVSTEISDKQALSNTVLQCDSEKRSSTTSLRDETPQEPLTGNEKTVTVSEEDGGEQEKHDNGGISNYFRIYTYCDRLDVVLYVVAVTGSILSGAALPLMTIVFGQFTTDFANFTSGTDSSVTPQEFRDNVDDFVLWFIYLFVGRFVISYIATEAASVAAIRVTRTIRLTFLESVLRQEVAHFDRPIGSISAQVTTNGTRINHGIAEKLVILVQAASLFVSAFVVSVVVQWKLALITMSIIPLIIVTMTLSITIDARLEAPIVRLHSQAAAVAQEALSSIKTIHAFWAHEKLVKTYDKFLTAAHKRANWKRPNTSIGNGIFNFCIFGGTALAFWQGYRMYESGEIDGVGEVLTVALSVSLGATAVSAIAPQLAHITNASGAAAELFSIINKKSKLDPLSPHGDRPPNCGGDIEIRNLTFAYPTRSSIKVLDSLNLSIPKGKTTGLVGASGCGKSTIVGLLERWYEPNAGEILLDGRDVAEYNIKWLRSTVRLVQQEPVLYRGTVFENVAKGLVDDQLALPPHQQLELVKSACELANAHTFVEELPHGYDTQVGERGGMLSGGQKQRLVIARSIISNPKVLLLDEATSALDPRSENIVQDALNKAAKNRTTLVIAHKLSTIKAADNIVVLSKGRVAEQGTHSELLAKGGMYAALIHNQQLGDTKETPDEDGGAVNEEKVAVEEAVDVNEEKMELSTAVETADTSSPSPTAGTLNYSLFRCLFIIVREQKDIGWHLGLLLMTCCVSGGAFPAQAVLFSRLIDVFTLTGSAAREKANFFALIFFIFALINMCSYLIIGWSGIHVGQVIVHRYRVEIFRRLLYLDQDFFDIPQNSSGALTSKLSLVPDSINELLSVTAFLVLICFINIAASCTLAIASGWKLGLVVVAAGMPVLIGSGYARTKLEQKFERETNERFADTAALATEAVTSIRTLAALTLERQIVDEYRSSLDHIAKSALYTISLTSLGYALSQSLEFLLMALGFWYGSRLLSTGEYSVTQYYTVFMAVLFGGQAAGQIFAHATSVVRSHWGTNWILWLRTLNATIQEEKDNADKGPTGDGSLLVEDVEFRYKQRDAARVLNGMNIHVPPGSYVACVGPSGCGKSTLIALLERFYDPLSGRITYGSSDIRLYSPRLYRSHISLVQQEPTLYEGSVRDNISVGVANEPSDQEILEACRQANALDFITSLPEGLDTPCGSKGLQFSGGQRQRIAIARALIRNPRLLLLDEATSALDTQSERVVQQALDKAASSRTTISVAHRLSTIRYADIIFVFANGKVVERGTHEELQRLRGRYWNMCVAQALDNSRVTG
ncbi:uncharacterized protein Z518_08927 [Rhinocladiella mackenziei CBS 650.93]|uniref:Rhinocladiella mackenziei CBS 650.93 unplaced genomic scaffold supercont1.7, whole genome shotgun sequence n=1 Tax=Rhinocladiella mackenziei CBS 650.93 TaxID=1442369 RepID=A0A0D2FGR2_9EURO|nr:uncharacterized protein Z518_08927 [Rhinocladiella mackenziei CBS 650.93]KIX01202.1 hypothetical protein Z518_08927 [Rhinocladiella mackenziei CBS 650.93]